MSRKHRGFLLVTVLLVLMVVSALAVLLYASTSHDLRFVQNEISRMQAEEIARSGVAYCRAYGAPPLVNGEPQKLLLFPEKNYIIQINQGVDSYSFTGTIRDGSRVRARVSLFTPLWDLTDIRQSP